MTSRAFIYTPRRQARFVVGREGLDQPEWCDVLDAGDGVAIQAALDAAGVLAGTTIGRIDVFLRPGVYTLAVALSIPERVTLWCEINTAILIGPSTGDHLVVAVGSFGALSGPLILIPESTEQRVGDSWVELATGANLLHTSLILNGATLPLDTVIRGVRSFDLGLGHVEGVLVFGPSREFFALPDSFFAFELRAAFYETFYFGARVRDCYAIACDGGFILGGNIDASGIVSTGCAFGEVLSNSAGATNRGPRLRGFQNFVRPISFGFGLLFEGNSAVEGASAIQGRMERENPGSGGFMVACIWQDTAARCTLSLCDMVGDPLVDTGINNGGASNPRALDCTFVDFAVSSSGPPVDLAGTLFLP